jgi:DNA invertase Pin-like site-specific DNA recombinase
MTPQKRCAIYTRKSTDEGLDMAFNSLDAQREACEAYIRSQRSEGWLLLPTAYDDGGFSGGSMERPGLKRLMADVQAGKVDVIVVYKVDRLTRALSDFAKIVDVLDAAGASFVSVTQAFNTTTSMGRLTLNVLLSFAQFEREVVAERVRDKVAASRAKGIWMGGSVPFGYDVVDKKLIPNPEEAAKVRRMFERYLALGAVRPLVAELKREGLLNRPRKGHEGEVQARPFARGQLYWLLSNVTYLGKVQHKGRVYEGEHEAIVPLALWDEVQAQISAARVRRTKAPAQRSASWLVGRIRDVHGRVMSPTTSVDGAHRNRYYASLRGATGHDAAPVEAKPVRVPAAAIEKAVGQAISEVLVADRVVALALEYGHRDDLELVMAKASELAVIATHGNHEGRVVPCQSLGVTLVVSTDAVEGCISTSGLLQALGCSDAYASDDGKVALSISTERLIRPRSTTLVFKSAQSQEPDMALVELMARAQRTRDRMLAGEVDPDNRHARRLVRLAYLSPAIVTAIVEGRQPKGMTAGSLFRMTRLPLEWAEQDLAVLG